MLGKIWRALAAFRWHDERVAALCDDLSVAVQKVDSDELKAWLLSMYNRCGSLHSFFLALPDDEPARQDLAISVGFAVHGYCHLSSNLSTLYGEWKVHHVNTVCVAVHHDWLHAHSTTTL
jgi:hypothetical protein